MTLPTSTMLCCGSLLEGLTQSYCANATPCPDHIERFHPEDRVHLVKQEELLQLGAVRKCLCPSHPPGDDAST